MAKNFLIMFFFSFFNACASKSFQSLKPKKIDLSFCCRKTAEGTYINTLIQSCIPAFSGTFGGVYDMASTSSIIHNRPCIEQLDGGGGGGVDQLKTARKVRLGTVFSLFSNSTYYRYINIVLYEHRVHIGVEQKQGSVSALSAEAYNTTMYVMVDISNQIKIINFLFIAVQGLKFKTHIRYHYR